MTLTDSNLRYLLAIHRLAQQNTEVSPLALAQTMGVTKPSVTSSLTGLMKQGVVVRRRYGKIMTNWSIKFCSIFRWQTRAFPPRNATTPLWPWP